MRKKMKKTLIKLGLVTALSTSLLGFTYEIKDGWQQLGAIEDIEDMTIFNNAECVDHVWYYDNNDTSNPQWRLHIADGNTYNYCGETLDSLKKGQGFWVKATGNCTIEIDEPSCNPLGMPIPPSPDSCDLNITNPDNNITNPDGANNPSEESAIPALTSNTDGTITVSASSILSISFDAWLAFDKKSGPNNTWEVAASNLPAWLKVDFTDSKIINKYRILPYTNDISGAPKKWTLQGSNDNTTWSDLDIREDETSWSYNVFNTYTFVNSNSYRYYRLNVEEENGRGYLDIAEFQLIEAQTNSNSDITGTATGEVATTEIIDYQINGGNGNISSIIMDNKQSNYTGSWTDGSFVDHTDYAVIKVNSPFIFWATIDEVYKTYDARLQITNVDTNETIKSNSYPDPTTLNVSTYYQMTDILPTGTYRFELTKPVEDGNYRLDDGWFFEKVE